MPVYPWNAFAWLETLGKRVSDDPWHLVFDAAIENKTRVYPNNVWTANKKLVNGNFPMTSEISPFHAGSVFWGWCFAYNVVYYVTHGVSYSWFLACACNLVTQKCCPSKAPWQLCWFFSTQIANAKASTCNSVAPSVKRFAGHPVRNDCFPHPLLNSCLYN